MPQKIFRDKSALVQVMVWLTSRTNLYLSQYWFRSVSLYWVSRKQWIKQILNVMYVHLSLVKLIKYHVWLSATEHYFIWFYNIVNLWEFKIQDISVRDIDLVLPKHSGYSTRGVITHALDLWNLMTSPTGRYEVPLCWSFYPRVSVRGINMWNCGAIIKPRGEQSIFYVQYPRTSLVVLFAQNYLVSNALQMTYISLALSPGKQIT